MTQTTGVAHPRYFNREISWLEFNRRVLEEALDERRPLLERAKFLSIFHSNLDEFFMIRVSGLKEQVESGLLEPSEDGLTPQEQIREIRRRTIDLLALASSFYHGTLCKLLSAEGISVLEYHDLNARQRDCVNDYFATTVYPVLTPLAVDPAHPFPHISNLSLSLAVDLRDPSGAERFARVKIPQVLPRLIPLDLCLPDRRDSRRRKKASFLWLESLIAAHLDSLFRGMKVVSSFPFRVIRDADLEIREDEAGDLLQVIERSLVRRRFGSVTQLIVSDDMPQNMRAMLVRNLQSEDADVFDTPQPLGMSALMAITDVDRPDLKDRVFIPRIPPSFRGATDGFAAIRQGDTLVHHPYDSFAPVVELVQAAAEDPAVLAIKQTIYRVGSNSPIVEALADASLNGKQVSVLVELKARFDEENNIEWARALEKAGVHVVYGDIGLKTHCKVLLIVRKETDGIRRYVHLGTGNYNAKTARLYTDLGLFTCDPAIGDDVTALFNTLTGYSMVSDYAKLLVSPSGIRRGILKRVEREIEHAKAGRPARIILKMNSLTDFRSADALYKASQAGVQVDLIIRASCCLVPGVPGLSDRIRVTSIVGRFLEHHRIYYFRNGGGDSEEVWLGSADMMQRNLDRRVETLFPLECPALKRAVVDNMLGAYLRDTRNARVLQPDGTYTRVNPPDGVQPFDSQVWFLNACMARDTANRKKKSRLRVED